MTYTDYAPKEWLNGHKAARKRHKNHVHDSDGFLSYLSKYQKHIALGLLGVLASAKVALSVVDYLSKGCNQKDPAAYSKSQPAQQTQTPESRLEQIAQENNVVIPKANVPAENPVQQPMQAEKKAETKEAKAPGISVDVLAGYISETYNAWNKKHNKTIPENVAHDYSNWIVKYAQQYNIDPKLLAALISHESRFMNVTGDLVVNGRKTTNNSEGLSQIRKLTQLEIKKLMKAKGEDIEVKYENLNNNPELAIRMTAFYLNYIMKKDNCTLWHAFCHYNAGMGGMNAAYANKVMGENSKIESYLSAHPQGKNL